MEDVENAEMMVELTKETRQKVHPLLRYDPHALDGIQLLKLEYLEAETTRAPVPRNQEVPESAFGTLTGRSVLVATSHAWFYQNHPDPCGVKLKVLREQFFPKLRERFPYTQILIFDDWHSCPQWPRPTKEEQNRFQLCMDHMNSMYCYCDVVLFVEVPLPDLDNTVLCCDLVPSKHKWLHFIDTIQYVESGDSDENDDGITIQKHDIVVGIDSKTNDLTIDALKQRKVKTKISYVRRPYGRPNQTLAEERGWLYAERITVAIRMAAAKPEMFDDVVMSNSLDLIIQICGWSYQLRTSARNEKKHSGSIKNQLRQFQNTLETMKFTSSNDDKLVKKLIKCLVKRFVLNWKEESRRQKDMATRTREILLRWGSFSEDYVERAELLCDLNDKKRTSRIHLIFIVVFVTVLSPLMAVIWFVIPLEGYGVDPSKDKTGMLVSSVWLGSIQWFVCSYFSYLSISPHTYTHKTTAVLPYSFYIR